MESATVLCADILCSEMYVLENIKLLGLPGFLLQSDYLKIKFILSKSEDILKIWPQIMQRPPL